MAGWEVRGFIHSQNISVWDFIITLIQMQEQNPQQHSFKLSMKVAKEAPMWKIWNPVRSVFILITHFHLI
jgi:hypothetical protein